MGLYNFKKQFVPHILDGSKSHTIRARRRAIDKPGDTCHLYTGLRQKGAKLLGRQKCLRVEDIRITKEFQIYIDGELLGADEADLLAWKDGFRHEWDGDSREGLGYAGCLDLMKKFWEGRLPFEGHIVHWERIREAV